MKLKSLTLIFFAFIAIHSFAQKSHKKHFDFTKDSIAKCLTPIEGKSIVYIVRPSAMGAAIRMRVDCDSQRIGANYAAQYIYTVLEPGNHTFSSKAENRSSLDILLEAGKIYYIKQQSKIGILYSETGLKLLSDEDGQKFLKKCILSKDNAYTNDDDNADDIKN
ncbi:MAG TPA: DUF2846 domain-containing protein [Arachidicoccus sp.]